MAAERTERLINLVICLLHTRSFISAERLRETIPGYSDAASDEAFKRMFERDKEDLRDLGIPLETGSLHNFDDEIGYRITRGDYALPDLTLEPDEAAAVGLAARMWSSAALGASATRALRKLEAAGVEITPLPEGLQPGVGAGQPRPADRRRGRPGGPPGALRLPRRERLRARGPPRRAVGRRLVARPVVPRRSRPRPRRRRGCSGSPASSASRWPRARPGPSPCPTGIDLTALVSASDPAGSDLLARIKVRHDRAIGLRRQTVDVVDDGGGWDVVTVPCPDPYALADQVLGYGADAVILAPAEAREAVVRRLETLVGGTAVSGATDHLPRLLALVPWLLAHPGTQAADVAREFDVTETQLRNDLNLLWMCGLPGYGPGDLIDVSWHGDRVTLSNADEMARPLRLTPEEALALVAALRVLSEVPGIIERSAIDRALAKLEAAAGGAAAADRVVAAPSAARRPAGRHDRHRRARPRPPAAAALLGAGPRRGHRARRRPDPGVHHRRAGLPRRLLLPGR